MPSESIKQVRRRPTYAYSRIVLITLIALPPMTVGSSSAFVKMKKEMRKLPRENHENIKLNVWYTSSTWIQNLRAKLWLER